MNAQENKPNAEEPLQIKPPKIGSTSERIFLRWRSDHSAPRHHFLPGLAVYQLGRRHYYSAIATCVQPGDLSAIWRTGSGPPYRLHRHDVHRRYNGWHARPLFATDQ